MKSKEVEVIKILLENKTRELNINQIAKLLKKDYKNTHNIVTRLTKSGVLELEQFGKSYKVVLVNKNHPILFDAEMRRRDELLKNKDLAVMYDSFRHLSSRLYVLLLFGSYAKGTQTKHSDIDLLFIIPDESEKRLEKEIMRIIDTLPLNIHVNIFTEADFLAMMISKERTVGSEALLNNIVLHNIEAFYGLIG